MPTARNYDHEVGKKYSRLTIKGWFRKDSVLFYECICDCGNTKIARKDHVVNNLTESCGCLRSEILTKRNTIHSCVGDKIYPVWIGIKSRAGGKVDHKQPNYIGATVCDEWEKDYLKFKTWFEDQVSKYPNDTIFNFEVDKDILVSGNKHYSPETCVVVPDFVNRFLTSRHNHRGTYALGVSKEGNRVKFRSYISINGKRKQLGSYNTELEAHKAWLTAKLNELRHIQSLLPEDVAQSLIRIAVKLENALDNDLFVDKL